MYAAGGASRVDLRMPASFALKKACAASAVIPDEVGTRPRQTRTSKEHQSRWGYERSAVTFVRQEVSRFSRSRLRYSRRLSDQTAVAAEMAASLSGSRRRIRRMSHSNSRTRCLATPHSSSNHASDTRRRHQTVYTGTSRSTIELTSVSYSRARPSTTRLDHASDSQSGEAASAVRKSAALGLFHCRLEVDT